MRPCAEQEPVEPTDQWRSFDELSTSGLLWLINRVVFHPRGFALAVLVGDDGEVSQWSLSGDGSEVWSFPTDIEDEFLVRATATMEAAKRRNQSVPPVPTVPTVSLPAPAEPPRAAAPTMDLLEPGGRIARLLARFGL